VSYGYRIWHRTTPSHCSRVSRSLCRQILTPAGFRGTTFLRTASKWFSTHPTRRASPDCGLRRWTAALLPVEGQQPLFGSGGEIFFRKVEGNSAFLYSVREDGSGLRKAAEKPLVNLFDVYPNHKWILIGMSPDGEVVFPTAGGAPIYTQLHPPSWLRWTGDGKHLFVAGSGERAKAFVLPLSPGQPLPTGLANAARFPSDSELAKMPGVRILPVANVAPGPTAEIYAFTREGVQRNLYRIPLP
jgi:hypothetical protein